MRRFSTSPPGWPLAHACLLALPTPAHAAHPPQYTAPQYTATQLFDVAVNAHTANNIPLAEAIYRALEQDPSVDVRCEARFRHGQLLEHLKRYPEAATLFRAILTEQPKAQRVLPGTGDGAGADGPRHRRPARAAHGARGRPAALGGTGRQPVRRRATLQPALWRLAGAGNGSLAPALAPPSPTSSWQASSRWRA